MAIDTNSGANLGFETDLWRAADALRSNMDAAEYKHVVLGLTLLGRVYEYFLPYSPAPKARMAASFTRRPRSSVC